MNLYDYLSQRLATLEQRNKSSSTGFVELAEIKGALAELSTLMTFVNGQEDLIRLEAKSRTAETQAA